MSLRYAGEEVEGNSDRRLVLMERLGYIEKTAVVETLLDLEAVERWLKLNSRATLMPGVYRYTCLKDLPDHFIYDDAQL
jgi:hypothetical protein